MSKWGKVFLYMDKSIVVHDSTKQDYGCSWVHRIISQLSITPSEKIMDVHDSTGQYHGYARLHMIDLANFKWTCRRLQSNGKSSKMSWIGPTTLRVTDLISHWKKNPKFMGGAHLTTIYYIKAKFSIYKTLCPNLSNHKMENLIKLWSCPLDEGPIHMWN